MKPEPSEIIVVLRAGCRECTDWPDCADCKSFLLARQCQGLRAPRGSKAKIFEATIPVEVPKKKGKKAPAPTQDTEKKSEATSAQRDGGMTSKMARALELEKKSGMSVEAAQGYQETITGVVGLINMPEEQLDQYITWLEE